MASDESAFFEEIRSEIRKEMVNEDSDTTRFITRHSLEEIWNDHRLEQLCKIANLDSSDHKSLVADLKKNMLEMVSILVFMEWKDWHRTRKIFFGSQPPTVGRRTNRQMDLFNLVDLAKDDLSEDERLAQEFSRVRGAFFPIFITKGMVETFDSSWRLPFLESEHEDFMVGTSSNGDVTKDVIAVRQYQYLPGKKLFNTVCYM